MAGRQKKVTAAEFIAELNADQNYSAARREVERQRAQAEMETRREEEPLLNALRLVGTSVDSVWDLVNTAEPYPAAIPILIEHLGRPYSRPVREGIIRALCAPAATPLLGRRLIEEFRREQDPELRWVIGNAIAFTADADQADDVVQLFEDTAYGVSRNRLALAVARLLGKNAIPILLRQIDDKNVTGEVIAALGELRAPDVRPIVAKYLKDPDSYLREQARKAMRRLDRKGRKRR